MKKVYCSNRTNKDFLLLSTIGIIMIVAGHCGCDFLAGGSFLPYYNFHVPLFVFVSGYFFSDNKSCLTWISHKVKRLILPYYITNFVFALVGYVLYVMFGFNNLVKKISWYSLLVDPLMPNTLSGFNSSAWFVIVLFYIELLYFLASKLIKYKHKDIILGILILVIGLIAIDGSIDKLYLVDGRNNLLIKNVLRVFCLFPFFPLGSIYRKYIEGKTRFTSIQSIALVIGILIVTYWYFPDYYGRTVIDYKQCTFSYYFPTYIVGICGIIFWLHISKMLSKTIGDSNLVNILGNNTFSIMTYHLFGFFLTNILILFVNKYTLFLGELDFALFIDKPRNSIYGSGVISWIYLIISVVVSLFIKYIIEFVKEYLYNLKERITMLVNK